jgi:hypothetical protein
MAKEKGGCKTCKKKKELTELPPVVELDYIPSAEDIKSAYAELANYAGVQEDKKPMIKKVYEAIFNETFDFACGGCISTQARKFKNYIKFKLKIRI